MRRNTFNITFLPDSVRDDKPVKISERLFVGSIDAAMNRDECLRAHITHMLIVAKEIYPFFPGDFKYKRIEIEDDEEEPLIVYLDECVRYIDTVVEEGGSVFVQCRGGVSRSASVAIGYLMFKYKMSLESAYHQVAQVRPTICINQGFIHQLKLFHKMGCSTIGTTTYHQKFQELFHDKQTNFQHKRKREASTSESMDISNFIELKRGKMEESFSTHSMDGNYTFFNSQFINQTPMNLDIMDINNNSSSTMATFQPSLKDSPRNQALESASLL